MAPSKTAPPVPPLSLAQFDARCLARSGGRMLAGIDEAGRGALAGPVVAAVVVLDGSQRFDGLNDSKQLTPSRRERLFEVIRSEATALAVGWASAEEIDRINILQATLRAARRALDALPAPPDLILTDYLKIQGLSQPVEPLVKGDARSQAVAAASVVAKVTRDAWMRYLDAEYPQYGFASHKGYGGNGHLDALRLHGPSTIHRHTFRGVSWFDAEYRRSITLESLMEKTRKGRLRGADPKEVWQGKGYLLPEREWEMFEQLCRENARAVGPRCPGTRE